MKKERNYSIELLRIVLMYAMCVEHAISQGGFYRPGLDHVLDAAVDGFMFISGYYGIRFSLKKMGKMICLAVWCAFVLNFARIFVIGDRTFGTLISSSAYTIAHSTGWWFFWAYLVVMCLSPLVEMAFGTMQEKHLSLKENLMVILPILFLCFGWNYLTIVPVVKDFIPAPLGFGNLSFLTLFGVYVFARTYRMCQWERFLTKKVMLILMPTTAIFVWLGSWHHNSIPQLLLATTVFRLFSVFSLSGRLNKVVAFIAPSMFAVYLLHVSGVGYFVVGKFNTFLTTGIHIPVYLAYFLAGTGVFIICATVDAIRRKTLDLIIGRFKR